MEQKFVKSHFVEINLSDLIEQLGEDETKAILSFFVCPLNKDIEYFIKYKAIEFSKRTTAKTHLVFWQTEDEKNIEFVGYYTITYKVITIDRSVLSNTEAKKLKNQGIFCLNTFFVTRLSFLYELPIVQTGICHFTFKDKISIFLTSLCLGNKIKRIV